MKLRPGQQRSNPSFEPYVHEQYTVKSYDRDNSTPETENPLAQMHNALVRAFNENARYPLPCMIVLIIGDEFFKMINHFDFGISHMIGKCLDWLISNIERLVYTRKLDLFHRRPGSVDYFEPKIIWLKMIEENHPGKFRPTAMLSRKFNAILEQALCQSEFSFIMKSIQFNRVFYDRNDKLNHDGCIAFWRHVSGMIKEFDKQKELIEPNGGAFSRRNGCTNLTRGHHQNTHDRRDQ